VKYVIGMAKDHHLPVHLDPLLKCKNCRAYCELPESILSGYCCECSHLRTSLWSSVLTSSAETHVDTTANITTRENGTYSISLKSQG
jgi:hypothetical protein